MRSTLAITLFAITFATITGSTACFGISDTDHTAALNKQKQAAQQQLKDALHAQAQINQQDLRAAQSQHAVDLAAKDDEISTARNQSAELQATIEATSAHNQQLTSERDAATSELTAQTQIAQNLQAELEHARTETRWSSYTFTNTNGSTVQAVTALATDPAKTEFLGLMAYCSEEGHFLYIWTEFPWEEDTTYTLRVGFDGAPMRNEDLWGFGDTTPAFADLRGDDLWRADTITVGYTGTPPTQFKFDTSQLHRMYADSQAFCDGTPPSKN